MDVNGEIRTGSDRKTNESLCFRAIIGVFRTNANLEMVEPGGFEPPSVDPPLQALHA